MDAALITGAVGLAGIGATLFAQGRTQRKATQDAREARVFNVRQTAYRDALAAIHLRLRGVEQVHPINGEHRDLLPPDDTELATLDAALGAFGSDAVRAAVAKFGDLVIQFRGAVLSFEGVTARAPAIPMEDGAREQMQVSRAAVKSQVLVIERLVQDELGTGR